LEELACKFNFVDSMSKRDKNKKENDIQQADRYALPLETYRLFKQLGNLKDCLPNEEASCGPIDDALSFLGSQYTLDDLMNKRSPEYKKGKELLLASLFAFIIRNVTKNEYVVCIPSEDRGTDIFIREIDYSKRQIIMHPIQICELPEQYQHFDNSKQDFEEFVYEFIREKKLRHYPRSNEVLLTWIETVGDRHLDVSRARILFESKADIPFSQIVVFGNGKGYINIASLYSRSETKHFGLKYHTKTRTIEAD